MLYDHEEVGSRSAQGAAGPLLADALERAVGGWKGSEPQGLSRALARSLLISADMAHAVHPNYADRHEPGHRPRVGGGPVIKSNANQSYASDADGTGHFASLCARLGITPQHFVTRSDLACGSTIGPITAARVGIRTVDVGSPMLSMHSCREMAGSADVAADDRRAAAVPRRRLSARPAAPAGAPAPGCLGRLVGAPRARTRRAMRAPRRARYRAARGATRPRRARSRGGRTGARGGARSAPPRPSTTRSSCPRC